MIAVFVDTNFFLQCKSYREVNWNDISNSDVIRILISRPVLMEIDKLKYDRNPRRAKRARRANSLFREMIDSAKQSIEFKARDQTVILEFAPYYHDRKLKWQCRHLDIDKPDDRIIASAIRFRKKNRQYDVYLLTYDTNPIILSKQCDLKSIRIPEDWLLPPGKDDRDKRIKNLEDEIASLASKEPHLHMQFIAGNPTNNEGVFRLKVERIAFLSDMDVDELLEQLKIKYPCKVELDHKKSETAASTQKALLGKYIPPTQEEIDKYTNETYPGWLEKLKKHIVDYQQCVNFRNLYIPFTITLRNQGNISVENLLVEFTVIKGGKIASPEIEDVLPSLENLEVPEAPNPPSGRWVSGIGPMLESLKNFNSLFQRQDIGGSPYFNRPQKHDRYGFYWKGGRPSTEREKWTFVCDEFRHKADPETFDYFFVLPVDQSPGVLIFECIASGKNIAEPLRKTYRLEIEYESRSLKKEIQHRLLL